MKLKRLIGGDPEDVVSENKIDLRADGLNFIGAKLLTVDIDTLDTDDARDNWSILDLMEKMIAKRKSLLRTKLLEEAEKDGEVDSNGSFKVNLYDGWIKKQKSVKLSVVDDRMQELLMKKDLPIESVYDAETKYTLNEGKLTKLMGEGIISAEELRSVTDTKVTWSLRVGPPTFVKALKETNQGLLK